MIPLTCINKVWETLWSNLFHSKLHPKTEQILLVTHLHPQHTSLPPKCNYLDIFWFPAASDYDLFAKDLQGRRRNIHTPPLSLPSILVTDKGQGSVYNGLGSLHLAGGSLRDILPSTSFSFRAEWGFPHTAQQLTWQRMFLAAMILIPISLIGVSWNLLPDNDWNLVPGLGSCLGVGWNPNWDS